MNQFAIMITYLLYFTMLHTKEEFACPRFGVGICSWYSIDT
jgi:hypothetical protein